MHFGRIPWTGSQSITQPLPKQANTTINFSHILKLTSNLFYLLYTMLMLGCLFHNAFPTS